MLKMIELDKLMSEIDWSQVSPKFLEKAVEEYRIREEEAKEVRKMCLSAEELERYYYGVPVVFPRKKHAYRIAMKEEQVYVE